MLLGALVDAGVPIDDLREALAPLKVEGVSLSCKPGRRGGVTGTQVIVDIDERGHGPRSWQELVGVVEGSTLPVSVVERARSVFHRLAEAEAAAHRVSIEDVHFHELGDLDTLFDVVGTIVGLDLLGVERLYSSPLPSGSGIIGAAHGVLPLPAPATAVLLAMAKAPVAPPPVKVEDAGEMVTPTGAALITTLATFRQPIINLDRVGYGLGVRESPHYPNVLALWTGEEAVTAYVTGLMLLETNIDDMSGEMLAYVQERLFELGARDVWFTPIQMKKSRPATMLSALLTTDLESRAVSLVMRETSSLGVRVRPVARYEAERESVGLDSTLGTVRVKVKRVGGRNVAVFPEYEDCRCIAKKRDMPIQDVYRQVQAEASAKLLST